MDSLSMKTMNKRKKKSHSIDQAKLKIVCDHLCDRIEELFEYFDLDYRSNDKMVSMACPIHDGDNVGAINLYITGDSYRGNWKCRTHNCEHVFKGSIIGFVRGILSNQKYQWQKNGDRTASFDETISFITDFLKSDLDNIKVCKVTKNKQQFSLAIDNLKNQTQAQGPYITRDIIRKNLSIPAQYYIDRGYSAEILDKYDVGLCTKPNREMSDRIVVPIYDQNHHYMIGCSGRTVHDKCTKCNCFHDHHAECPNEYKQYLHSKWRHSANFKSQHTLYNIWYANEYIKAMNSIIIVESPGNVWRLEEAGIHNSVAIFGCSLSDRQKMIIDASGAMSMIILTDNDDPGRKAAQQIALKCQNTYKVYTPLFSANDIGDMSIDDINTQIKPLIEKLI